MHKELFGTIRGSYPPVKEIPVSEEPLCTNCGKPTEGERYEVIEESGKPYCVLCAYIHGIIGEEIYYDEFDEAYDNGE